MPRKIFYALVISLAGLLQATPLLAQVPPHAPGSICFTPNFWCWVSTPGIPGNPCYCYDNNNRAVNGTLG